MVDIAIREEAQGGIRQLSFIEAAARVCNQWLSSEKISYDGVS